MTHEPCTDLLTGARAIAAFMGWSERSLRHREARLPTFRIGRTLCARRSTLAAWLAAQEAAAMPIPPCTP